MSIKRYIVVLLLMFSYSSASLADEVYLTDGSHLVGTVLKLQEGKLVLQTKHAGKITINMSGVEGIRTDKVHGIASEDLAPHFGTLEYEDGEQRLVVEKSETIAIAPVGLTLLWPQDEKMPKPTRFWRGRVELGLNGSDGNSDRISFTGRSEATRKTDENKLLLYFHSYYAEDNGVRSHNEIKAGGRYEWKFTKKWSGYTRIEFEEDEFEELDLRSTLVLGMSYSILDEKNQSLSARFGLGYLRENFETAPTEDDAILDLGYDYMIKIRDWTKITHDLTYYSGLDSPTEEFRIVANTAAEVPLTKGLQWRLRAGVKHEYDDEPLPGIEELDTTYYLNLVYDW